MFVTDVTRHALKHATDFRGRASRSEFWMFATLTHLFVWGGMVVFLMGALYCAGVFDVLGTLQEQLLSGAEQINIDITDFNAMDNGSAAVIAWRWGSGIWSLIALLLAIPTLSVTVRQLHDAGLSGLNFGWILLPFFGLVVLIVLLLLPSDRENAYGMPPTLGE